MKKLRLSLMALALVGGVSGALVSKIQAAPKPTDATYHWQKYNHDGTRNPGLDKDETISAAEMDYQCSSTVTQCAVGTKDPGSGDGPLNPILRFAN